MTGSRRGRALGRLNLAGVNGSLAGAGVNLAAAGRSPTWAGVNLAVAGVSLAGSA